MPGTNPGGNDPLTPTESNDPGSADEPLATPLTPPISEADQRQWDEDRAAARRLIELLERIPIPEEPEPSPMMVVRFLRSLAFGDGPLLPAGAVTRIDEESALDMLERWPERIECATEEELREYDAHKAELDLNEVAGQAVPLADAPDVPAPPRIVRFLDSADGMIDGRPIRRGTIAEIEEAHAWDLYKYRTFGIQELGAKVEWATEAELRAYEALMLEADKNEEATANDPLSQQLSQQFKLAPPETPKLIVRIVREGGLASLKRSCPIGEVWPVEKELAIRQLLAKEPLVELATPEELRRDRVTIDHSEGQSKSQVDARRKHRFKNGIPHSGPSTLVVRFLTPGRFAIHVTQGIIYEKRAEGCETLPCAAGEIWEIEQDFAYRLLRGKSPIGTLASEAEWEAYRNTLTQTSVPVEVTHAVDIDRLRGVDEGRSPAKQPVPQDSLQGLLSECKQCVRKAYSQYLRAMERHPDITTDAQAYAKVLDDLDDGETLTRMDHWIRYLRTARKALGTRKNKPRKHRTGRSVVQPKDI